MKTFTKSALFLLWLIPMSFFAQSTVKGTVTSAVDGQPIPGVNIVIKGTTNGAATDFDGEYSLGNVNSGDILVFSYVGFIPREVSFTGNETINVSLQEDAAELEQVVVIGYGNVRKKSLSGSISTVTAEDFNQGNNVTAENLFTGRVAGLTVNTGGSPASNSQIRIRGGASLNASNNPLIVIDGLPLYDAGDLANGSRSILSTLNPDDIESFSVLKDASAAAIYGNRGANGVIIITTKKGKQKLQISLDAQTGVNTLINTIDVFSPNEYRSFVADNLPNRVELLGNANTDWQDAIYRDAFSSIFNVSLSGSILKVLPTRLSVNRTDQEGLRLTSKFERTATSLSLNPRFFDGNLKFDINANLNFERNRFADGVEGAALSFDPTQPIFDPNSIYGGYYEYTNPETGIVLDNTPRNPVSQLLSTRNIASVRRYYGNFKIDYRLPFLTDVRAVVNLGLDHSETDRFFERDAFSPLSFNATSGEQSGVRSDTDVTTKNNLLDTYLNYDKTLGDFVVQATAGYSYQKFEFEKFETFDKFDPNAVPLRSIAPDRVLIAYFFRTNLSYANKFFLSGSIRRDGTSVFAEKFRWGYFPAVSAAWSISEENFLKNSKTLSNLKLRLGYGTTGQQDIGPRTDFLERYRLSNPNSQYLFNGELITIAQAQFRNESLKWEEITEYNIGLDYGFANDRIRGAIDLFRKESDDLLSEAPIADGANFTNSGFQNIGKFITQGVEFTIDTDIVDKKNFKWNINYNATYIDREIEELAFGADVLVSGIDGGTGNTIQIQRQGFAPFSFFTYAQLYDQQGNPVEGAYADLNGDNLINNEDRYISGNGAADVTMGFQSKIFLHNFDFNFNLRASLGNEIYNNVNSSRAQLGNAFRNVLNNIPTSVLESNFRSTPDVLLSDYYVEDASFLRMDNITLGYTIRDLMKGVSSLRLWAGVNNAFVITDYSGLDPEIINNGIDNTIFPRGRTYLMGINYKF